MLGHVAGALRVGHLQKGRSTNDQGHIVDTKAVPLPALGLEEALGMCMGLAVGRTMREQTSHALHSFVL